MPSSSLVAACCCRREPSCGSPYIVFRPCNELLDVPDVVATPFIQEECGFVGDTGQIYKFRSPYCNQTYCGSWTCDPEINEDTDYCAPQFNCDCDANSKPRLIRPSDNICERFESLGFNDSFEDGSCCDTRCPEREASCYDGDVSGNCPEGSRLRGCECTFLDDLQYNLSVTWQQGDTMTLCNFDYYDQNGNFVFNHFEMQNIFVRLNDATVIEGATIACGDHVSGGTYKQLLLECRWDAVFNQRAPNNGNVSVGPCASENQGYTCYFDNNRGLDVSWVDTLYTRDAFYVGIVGDKAVFKRGNIGPPYLDVSTPENVLSRGNGCDDFNGSDRVFNFLTFLSGLASAGASGGNIATQVESDPFPGIEICAGMTGEHSYTTQITGRPSPGTAWGCTFGGPVGPANYGEVKISMRLTTPPAPNQQGSC